VTMRFNWETGYSFDAGKRLGNFWKILIGEPEWIDHESYFYQEQEQEVEPDAFNTAGYDERYPLAVFYAAFFEEIWHESYYDQIEECLIPDDLHMDAMGMALHSLDPFDQPAWEKYFGVVELLN